MERWTTKFAAFKDSICKRQRPESMKTDAFVNLGRKKFQASAVSNGFVRVAEVSRPSVVKHLPAVQRLNSTEPYEIYKLVVSPEDEKDKTKLIERRELLLEVLEKAQKLLENRQSQIQKKQFYTSSMLSYLESRNIKDISSEHIAKIEEAFQRDSDEVFCQVTDQFITYKDIQHLTEAKVLSQKLAAAYLHLLKTPEGVKICPSALYSALERMNNTKNWEKLPSELHRFGLSNLEELKMVILPAQLKNMTWVVVAINNNTKSIECYDSSDSCSTRVVFETIGNLLRQLRFPSNYNWVTMSVPLVKHRNDCGVCMLKNIHSIVDGFEYKSAHIKFLRILMVFELQHNYIFN